MLHQMPTRSELSPTLSKDGVMVVDKPQGLTSFDVVRQLRRQSGQRRVGHAGTLDPMATGVLLVCLGEATKLVPYLMDADKEYCATARLGVSTDTDDAAPGSRVLQVASVAALQALRPEAVTAALAAMVGELCQRPPRFSALKVAGERLYDRARGELSEQAEAELLAQLAAKQRTVRIDAITVESLDLDSPAPEVRFSVRCGKGTYIRALARDLGEQLGVGAHLTALRRLRVGRFRVQDAGEQRHGLAAALGHLPQLVVSAELAGRLRQGHKGALLELCASRPPAGSPAAVLTDEGSLVAVVEPVEGHWIIGRGFIV
jgi:tRNA pseudouridine55 synthase